MPEYKVKNKRAFNKWKILKRKINLMNFVIFGKSEFVTSSKQVKGLFSGGEDKGPEVNIYFRNGKNFIDELFLELTTSDIRIENIPIIFVRYYNFLFIGRYLVVQLILVTAQKLKVFQALIILLIQIAFVSVAMHTQVKKGGLYENRFLAYYNIVQEFCIVIFLLITVINGFGFANWTGEKGVFYLEFIGAVSVMISLFIEILGFVIVIGGFFFWIVKVGKKYLCRPCLAQDKKKKKKKTGGGEGLKVKGADGDGKNKL